MNIQPYEHTVQYYETDRMQVVHHSNYIRWFEEARTYWMDMIGVPYVKVEELGILIPVLEVSAQYKSMVTFGETVLINLVMDKFNGIKASFSYEITEKASGRLCTVGSSSHCFLDIKNKPISLKKNNPHIYEIFKNAVAEQI